MNSVMAERLRPGPPGERRPSSRPSGSRARVRGRLPDVRPPPPTSEAEAEVEAGPEDALVQLRVAELEVVGDPRPEREASRQVEVEVELRPGDEPGLDALAVDAAEVGGQVRPHEAQVGREAEAQHRAPRQPVVGRVEGVEDVLLQRQRAEARHGAERELRAAEVALGVVLAVTLVLLLEVVPVDRAEAEDEALRPLRLARWGRRGRGPRPGALRRGPRA